MFFFFLQRLSFFFSLAFCRFMSCDFTGLESLLLFAETHSSVCIHFYLENFLFMNEKEFFFSWMQLKLEISFIVLRMIFKLTSFLCLFRNVKRCTPRVTLSNICLGVNPRVSHVHSRNLFTQFFLMLMNAWVKIYVIKKSVFWLKFSLAMKFNTQWQYSSLHGKVITLPMSKSEMFIYTQFLSLSLDSFFIFQRKDKNYIFLKLVMWLI